jgi:hypothetical protein
MLFLEWLTAQKAVTPNPEHDVKRLFEILATTKKALLSEKGELFFMSNSESFF